MTAFDADSGQERWAAPDITGQVIGIRGSRLLVWDGSVLSALDPDDGSVLVQHQLPGVSRLALSDFANGDLFAVSDEGLVIRLVPGS